MEKKLLYSLSKIVNQLYHIVFQLSYSSENACKTCLRIIFRNCKCVICYRNLRNKTENSSRHFQAVIVSSVVRVNHSIESHRQENNIEEGGGWRNAGSACRMPINQSHIIKIWCMMAKFQTFNSCCSQNIGWMWQKLCKFMASLSIQEYPPLYTNGFLLYHKEINDDSIKHTIFVWWWYQIMTKWDSCEMSVSTPFRRTPTGIPFECEANSKKPKKYFCLIKRKMQNKRGIFKTEIFLDYQ